MLLVINLNQGAVIGKGMWRFIGTLIGMLAAFALMAAAGQMPLLFILGFGAWLGLCVAGMTVLRHFRASGVVVAGYTIGLATYGAMGHPERTFEHVMARGSTVAVGVACLTLVVALLSRRGLRARLEAAYAGLAARVARAIPAPDGERVRQGLVGEIYGVDDLLALGKAESDELVRRAAAVRNGMTALFGALVGAGETLPPGAAARPWRRCGNRWGEPGTRPPVRWTEARRGVRRAAHPGGRARRLRGGGDGDTAAGRPGGSRLADRRRPVARADRRLPGSVGGTAGLGATVGRHTRRHRAGPFSPRLPRGVAQWPAFHADHRAGWPVLAGHGLAPR